MNLSVKYWLCHKKQAFSILFVIIAGTMAVTISVLLARSQSRKTIEEILDFTGNYDIVVPDLTEPELKTLEGDKDIAEIGQIWNGGVCENSQGTRMRYGAMEDEAAAVLYHFSPEKGGRYPLKKGEIAGYKTAFESMGAGAVVGNTVRFHLYDIREKDLGEREFKITGVLDDQKSSQKELIRTIRAMDAENSGHADLPQLFISKADLPEDVTMTGMLLCRDTAEPWEVCTKLSEKGISAYAGERINELCAAASIDAGTEEQIRDRAHFAYRDFYSAYMIPFFTVIIFMVSFISIYGIMTSAWIERQRQFGVLRCIGMSRRQTIKMYAEESCFFGITGVLSGYVLGMLVYLAYYYVVSIFSDITMYNAFYAPAIARAISLSPYTYPWLFSFLFTAAAFFACVFRASRSSILEMLHPERRITRRKKRAGIGTRRIVSYYIGSMFNRSAGITAVIFITTWTLVFGAAFMLAKADHDSLLEREMLKKVSAVEADYSTGKDFDRTMLANVQFNRHKEGISKTDYKMLRESEDTEEVTGVVKMPGIKLLYKKEKIPDALKSYLSPLNVSNNISDFLAELDEKSRSSQGYADTDLLYNVPAVAVDTEMFDRLEKYVIAGKIDREGVEAGRKIILVEYKDVSLENYFHVGDTVTISDTVISNEKTEAYDFSENVMPAWEKPAFTYDYADGSMTGLDGYSFGKRKDQTVEVCALLRIREKNLKGKLYCKGHILNEEKDREISQGYNLLCSKESVRKWGYPDVSNTNVYVDLKDGADENRFESLWYAVLGRSGSSMESVSEKAVKRTIKNVERSNIIIFASMIVMVILLGISGMVNSYHFAMKKNLKKLQILRAVGLSKRKLVSIYIRKILLWPVLAGVTSVLPVVLFDALRKYAYHYAFDLNHNGFEFVGNGEMKACWQVMFPWYIKLWEQPVAFIIFLGIVTVLLVNILAGIFSVRSLQRFNITDGIRREEF